MQTEAPTNSQEDTMSTDPLNPAAAEEERRDETRSTEDARSTNGPDTEQELDEQVEESFPASDPPANY
ncbi:hypothetical protein GCM10010977_04410 [Citricoccus zhacaiensis]|uniref:Uncharacterized protein n=2 Tax=Citricoccus zhacaiensis TaxID=489142 RepID=A0ABQ2LQ75_9MICC|nr:hypothetical protein GCM10010977_04410 [Citricoccus zhacaiensis]